jgi:hypothetical protein
LASQLRFEGPELEELLDRVRKEVGVDANIIAANRIRKGGIGGFFAREGFEVVVDITGEQPGARLRSRNGARTAPASVLDLADEVSVSEAAQTIDVDGGPDTGFADVVDVDEPVIVSTQREDFGSLLAKLTRELDEQEQEIATRTDVATPMPGLPHDDDVPVDPRMHYRRVTAEPTAGPTAPVSAAVSAAISTPMPAPVLPAPDKSSRAPRIIRPAARAGVAEPRNARSSDASVPANAPVPSPAPAPVPAPAPPARQRASSVVAPAIDRTNMPDARLLALGLPAEYAPSMALAGTDETRTALVQKLAQLPAPPMLPRASGVVIAVVGIGTAPIALARRIADDMEIENEHITLATPESVSELSHPDEADAFRRSCRRRAEPTIVACSIGSGRAQLGWARRMLDRLEPTVTWAVVEASCKAEDIAHRLTLLGGADVLALTGVADTVSPAAVLSLGIPVGRIGSTYATPASWADLLMERLERAVDRDE